MYENNLRLIDEAISSEPIKNTFRLGWEFITLNKQFTLTMISVLIVLSYLGMIPTIGFIFTLFFSALSMAIQIYVGRLVYESNNIETFVGEIQHAKGETIIQRYFAPALGAYMGWLVIGLVVLLLLTFMIGMTGVSESTLNSTTELVELFSLIGFPILIIVGLVSYIQPLVQANVVLSNDFKEGFFAVMTLFSIELWRQALQKSYFKYMFWLGLIVLGASLVLGLLFSIFSAIPILNIVVMIIFVYVLVVFMSVASVMAKRIIE